MTQNVLDGVMQIEAKAAKRVGEAKAQAKGVRERVEADLKGLAEQLDSEAKREIAEHREGIEARKQAALAELDRQLESLLAAVETVEGERVGPLAEEVVRLLEQRADGD